MYKENENKIFNQNLDMDELMCKAIMNKNFEEVKVLVDQNINLNKRLSTKVYKGDTYLHYACRNHETKNHEITDDSVNIIKLLMSKMDINTFNAEYETPLHILCGYIWPRKNNFEMTTELVKLFLEAGAYVDARNERGNTPVSNLHSALQYFPIFKLLVQYGANFALKDNDGKSAFYKLSHYMENYNYNRLKYLFEQSVPIPGSQLDNALIHACYYQNEKLIYLLLRAGASINSKGEYGDVFQTLNKGFEDMPIWGESMPLDYDTYTITQEDIDTKERINNFLRQFHNKQRGFNIITYGKRKYDDL